MKQLKSQSIIYFFCILKFFAHIFTNTNYGLHRDEYLYFTQGQHLGWGYMEVPPLLAVFARLSDFLGGSVFMIRLFPAIIGVITIYLAGKLVIRLGGKNWAVVFTCLGILLSSAFLWSNSMFQPVSFNQFFWFLSAYVLVLIFQTNEEKYWYVLGVVFGFAFLVKYSILFYAIGLITAVLLSPHRKVFLTKYPYIALGIALIIASPNLIWQYQHNFPVMAHMAELRDTQLLRISVFEYILPHFYFHSASNLIWLSGLISLLFFKKWRKYQFAGIAFITTICIIGLLSGKSYYNIGAFTILFVFGGLQLASLKSGVLKGAIIFATILSFIPVSPLSLPYLSIENFQKYASFVIDDVKFSAPFQWEDGKVRRLTQDIADMHGWEEMTEKVSKYYQSLSPEVQQKTHLLAAHYGHAGALTYFQEKYQLPDAHSFNGSFLMWMPNNLQFDHQILVADEIQGGSDWFSEITLVDSVENPYARDRGYIYFRTKPKHDNWYEYWQNMVTEEKRRFNIR